MDETKLSWDDLRLFLSVAWHQGLAGAAAETGKSPPTLARRMAELESTLRADLFRRHARGYDLTAEGDQLMKRALEVEASIRRITDARPSATRVKLSAGLWTTRALARHAATLRGDDPITLRFVAADGRLDITHREVSIGIRNARPTQLGLAGQRLGPVHFAVYGTADLPLIRVVGSTPSAQWTQAQDGPAPYEVMTSLNALDLARAGVGTAVLPCFIGDLEPDLTRRSDIIHELSHDRWLVTHDSDRFEPPVRRVIDRLVKLLS